MALVPPALTKYFEYVEMNWVSYAQKNPYLSVPALQALILKSWKVKSSSNSKVTKSKKKKVKPQPFFSGLNNPHFEELLSSSKAGATHAENNESDEEEGYVGFKTVSDMNKVIAEQQQVSTFDSVSVASDKTPEVSSTVLLEVSTTESSTVEAMLTSGALIIVSPEESATDSQEESAEASAPVSIEQSVTVSTDVLTPVVSPEESVPDSPAPSARLSLETSVTVSPDPSAPVSPREPSTPEILDSMLGGAELEVYSEVELGDGGESVAEDVGNTSETLEEVVSLDEADHNDSNEAARKAALTVYTNKQLEDTYETNICAQVDEDALTMGGGKRKNSDVLQETRPAKRKNFKPNKFVPPRKVSCGVKDCIFCNSPSCRECKNCLRKKKCTKRDCPNISSQVGRFQKTIADMAISPDHSIQDNDKAFAALIEDDIGRNYEAHNTPNIDSGSSSNNNIASEEGNVSELVNVASEGNFESVSTSEYEFELCRKSYQQLKSYNVHKCVPKNQKLKCPSCSKNISQANFAKHIKLHSKPRYPCNQCPKIFPTKTKLDKHVEQHENCKCGVCGKKFAVPFSLKRHMKVHTNINLNEGELGDIETSLTDNNKDNAADTSNTSMNTNCKFCEVELRTLIDLTKHLRTNHSDMSMKCDKCAKVFFSVKGLNTHKKLHNLPVNSTGDTTGDSTGDTTGATTGSLNGDIIEDTVDNPNENIVFITDTSGQVISTSDLQVGDLGTAMHYYIVDN